MFKTNNLRALANTFNCTHSFQDAVKSLIKEGKIKLIASFTLLPNRELTAPQKRDLDLILNQTDFSLCNVNPFNVVIKANTRGCNARVLNSLAKKGFLAEKDYDFYEELYIKDGVKKREFLITAKGLIIQVVLSPNHEWNFKKEETQEEAQEETQDLSFNNLIYSLVVIGQENSDFIGLDELSRFLGGCTDSMLEKWNRLNIKYIARRIQKALVFGIDTSSLKSHLSANEQESIDSILDPSKVETQEETQDAKMDKLGLTELEKSLLIKILDGLFDENISDITLDDVSDDLNRDRGVLSSLIKKGVVEIEEYESQQYNASLPNSWGLNLEWKIINIIHLCKAHWPIFKPEWV